jgi:hypothetical protein
MLENYPYITYDPSKIAASMVATLIGLSMLAWCIQSYQNRFRPSRLSILMFLSHLAIFIELILHAAISPTDQRTRTVFMINSTLFTIAQRMLIMCNTLFLMEIRAIQSRPIVLSTMVMAVLSALMTVPANILSFESSTIDQSFSIRQVATALLLFLALCFYPVLIWSKTMTKMSQSGLMLMFISSVVCVVLAIFNVFQAVPRFVDRINAEEGWYYGFQIGPIVLAHCLWSILHSIRTVRVDESLL